MFADARGVGVLGLPTSAIVESIRKQIQALFSPFFLPFLNFVLSLHTTIVGNIILLKQQDENISEGVFSQYVLSHHISLVDLYCETIA